MSLENIEFIIFNKPFVSSSLNAAGRSLSISSTAIKHFTPLKLVRQALTLYLESRLYGFAQSLHHLLSEAFLLMQLVRICHDKWNMQTIVATLVGANL